MMVDVIVPDVLLPVRMVGVLHATTVGVLKVDVMQQVLHVVCVIRGDIV